MQIGLAVLIDGLPSIDSSISPCLQLASIESELRSIAPRIWTFDWSKVFGFRSTYLLLREGKFGRVLARKFNSELRQRTHNLAADEKIIVIAYSFGGLIFYEWVNDPLTKPEDRNRIALAVTIAAPYRNLLQSVNIEAPEGKILTLKGIQESAVKPGRVLQKLPAGTLKILLAEQDFTVLRHDSSFLDDPSTLQLRHLLQEEPPIERATHSDICVHKQTLEYIRTYCENLVRQ